MCEEKVDVNYTRKNGEETTLRIDKCISKLIEELNKHGIRTISSSCCGHGDGKGGHIFIDEDCIMKTDCGYMLLLNDNDGSGKEWGE